MSIVAEAEGRFEFAMNVVVLFPSGVAMLALPSISLRSGGRGRRAGRERYYVESEEEGAGGMHLHGVARLCCHDVPLMSQSNTKQTTCLALWESVLKSMLLHSNRWSCHFANLHSSEGVISPEQHK